MNQLNNDCDVDAHIVLVPQRSSFGTGCHVAPGRNVNSPEAKRERSAVHFLLLLFTSIPFANFTKAFAVKHNKTVATEFVFIIIKSGICCVLMSRNRRDGHRIGSGRIQISEKYVERELHDHRVLTDRERDRSDRWYDRCGNGTKVVKVIVVFGYLSFSCMYF